MRQRCRRTAAYLVAFSALFLSQTVFAETVDIQESFSAQSIDVIRIREERSGFGIIFRNNVEADVRFSHGSSRDIQVSLQGSVDSSRRFRGSRLEVLESRGELELVIQLGVGFALFFSQTGDLVLDVQVPQSWRGDLIVGTSSGAVSVADGGFRDLKLDVSSGAIEIGRITARDVEVDSSSGRTTIQELRAETFDLDSSSGGAEIDRLEAETSRLSSSSGGISVGSAAGLVEANLSSGRFEIAFDGRRGRVVADSSSGGVDVADIAGSVDIDSSSGSVTVSFASISGDSSIEASSGDVRVRIPQGAGLNVDLETSSGRIRVDVPVVVQGATERDALSGAIGGGGPTLRVRASSGDIFVSE